VKPKRPAAAVTAAPPAPSANPVKPVAALALPAAPAPGGFWQAWQNFWFTPRSPLGLHALRVLAGLLFVAWLLPFAGQQEALFSLDGWFDREAYLEASRLNEPPPVPLGWSLLYATGGNAALVHVFYWGALVVFLLFTLGVATRLTSILTWVLIVSFLANPATRFEADYLLALLAFYLMIGYVLLGQWSTQPTPLARALGGRDTWLFGAGNQADADRPSYAANLAVRLLQVHFALVVLSSALHKLQFGAWWSGVALWYPLHGPFTTSESDIRSLAVHRGSYLFLLSLVQYAVLAWQLAFPLYAWRPGRFRWLLLGGAVLGWLGCWFIYHAPLFGPVYVIGCLSYLRPEEWQALRARLSGVLRRGAGNAAPTSQPQPAATAIRR
jgi:hypothetical protein